MLKRAIIAAAMLAVPVQASAESWLCIPDMATGFRYDKILRKWTQSTFQTDGERMIIKKASDPQVRYEVREFGKDDTLPLARCQKDFTEYGFLKCEGILSEFKFNKKNMRYIRTYLAGYVEIIPGNTFMKEGNDTPLIEIGRCSAI